MVSAENKDGFMNRMHVKELVFFSEQAQYNQNNDYAINYIDIINSDELKPLPSKQYHKNTPILILPLFKQDLRSFFKKGSFYNNKNLDYAVFFIKRIINLILSLHSQNISHNDLKMNNILMDSEFNMKLIDFGSYKYDFNKINIENMIDQNINKVEYEIEMNNRQLSALLVRVPEQNISLKSLTDEQYKRIFNGQYSDSYVLGQTIFELLMGMQFNGPANEGDKQEIIVLGQQIVFFKNWEQIYKIQDIDIEIDKQELEYQIKYYQNQVKQIYKEKSLQEIIENILIQKYSWSQKISQLAEFLAQLLNPDISQRKTITELQDQIQWIIDFDELKSDDIKKQSIYLDNYNILNSKSIFNNYYIQQQ